MLIRFLILILVSTSEYISFYVFEVQLKSIRVHLALITVSFLFGIAYVIGKYLLEFLPPAAWSFTRAAGAAIILMILFGKKILEKPPSQKQWLWILGISLLGVGINQVVFFEGLIRTTPTHAAVINTTVPVFTLLVGILIGEERWNRMRGLGMFFSFIGVLGILNIENQSFESRLLVGDLLNVINSLSFSIYLAVSKKLNRQLDPMVVTTGMFMFGALSIGIYGGPTAWHVNWSLLPTGAFLAMAYLILGSTVGTYCLNNWALSRVDSSAVALYIYIQPVIAGLLSRAIYNETLSLRFVLGSLLVFAGVAIGNLRWRKSSLSKS